MTPPTVDKDDQINQQIDCPAAFKVKWVSLELGEALPNRQKLTICYSKLIEWCMVGWQIWPSDSGG